MNIIVMNMRSVDLWICENDIDVCYEKLMTKLQNIVYLLNKK